MAVDTLGRSMETFSVTCESLFARMGFECRERSPGVYRVFTPLSFCDGEPIGLYFIQKSDTVHVSDNANTLFHLRSVGMDVSDRKKWKGIRQIVENFGIKLRDSGEVTAFASTTGAADLVSRYMAAMLSVADLERETFGITAEVSTYIDEVEEHLKMWKPDLDLILRPMVTGHSGRVHNFHFQFGDELIEAARPHSNRTGSILRKAADIQNSANPFQIMVVMDDREDPDRARAESDILMTMVKVLPFTRLASNSGSMSVRH